jgi:hypothetical protein
MSDTVQANDNPWQVVHHGTYDSETDWRLFWRCCKAINICASFRSIETVQGRKTSLIPLESRISVLHHAQHTEPIVSNKGISTACRTETHSTHLHTMWRTRGEKSPQLACGQAFHLGIEVVAWCMSWRNCRVLALANWHWARHGSSVCPSGDFRQPREMAAWRPRVIPTSPVVSGGRGTNWLFYTRVSTRERGVLMLWMILIDGRWDGWCAIVQPWCSLRQTWYSRSSTGKSLFHQSMYMAASLK